MNKNIKIVMGIIVLIIVAWVAYSVGKSQAPTQKEEGTATGAETREEEDASGPIKIGFYGPQSGDVATIGEIALEAAKFAVKEINDAGGVKGRQLELVSEDSECNPTGGINAVNKLISVDKVHVLLGGLCSAETAPAAPIAQAAGVPMMSYCASAPSITKVGDYIFRDYPSDVFQSVYGAEYAYNKLGKKSAAILYVKNDWGQGLHDGFTEKFKALGGTIVADESFTQDSRDLRTTITKIKEAKPDIVVFYSYTEAGIVGLKQMKELGITTPILGGDAMDDPKYITEAKEAAEGVLYTVPHIAIQQDFQTEFQQATGKEIKICVAQSYDAVKIFAKVIEEVGTSKQAIKNALFDLKDYQGVSGKISFNADGDLVDVAFDVKVIKDGKVEVVQ